MHRCNTFDFSIEICFDWGFCLGTLVISSLHQSCQWCSAIFSFWQPTKKNGCHRWYPYFVSLMMMMMTRTNRKLLWKWKRKKEILFLSINLLFFSWMVTRWWWWWWYTHKMTIQSVKVKAFEHQPAIFFLFVVVKVCFCSPLPWWWVE